MNIQADAARLTANDAIPVHGLFIDGVAGRLHPTHIAALTRYRQVVCCLHALH